jgi:RNA polymerase sigma factor (sigma-70 family)
VIAGDVVEPSGKPVTRAVGMTGGFDEFFAAEYRRLVVLATALCGSRVLGEDVVQDVMFDASRRWGKLSAYDDPARWARGAVARRSSNVRRGRFREARAVARLAGRLQHEPAALPVLEGDTFWNAVRALPRRQRECVALRYLDDLTTAEVARTLGITETTVRVHLHAARSTLAIVLGTENPDD